MKNFNNYFNKCSLLYVVLIPMLFSYFYLHTTENNNTESNQSSSQLIPRSGEESKKTELKKKNFYFIPGFWGNLFDINSQDPHYGYDLRPMYQLYETALKKNYDLILAESSAYSLKPLNQPAIENIDNVAGIFTFEIAQHQIDYLSKFPKEKLILILWEPPTTMPQNYNPIYHEYFSRVYTWRDDLVDNKKYFKIYYPALRPMISELVDFNKKNYVYL
jgi:hypothetical protein